MNADLMERVTALRAAIAKVKTDLDAVVAAEAELAEALRAAGIDDAITTVDLPTVAGLPSRRKKRAGSTSVGERDDLSTLKAAGAGAGLMVGISLVVLLAINLFRQPTTPAPVTAPAPSAAPLATTTAVPPPEPVPVPVPVPSAVASVTSATAEPSKPEMGGLTILCTPRCDAISDNGIPLSPGNLVGIPVIAGPHRIEARANGGAKRTYSVTVNPGQTREVRISLEQPHDRGF